MHISSYILLTFFTFTFLHHYCHHLNNIPCTDGRFYNKYPHVNPARNHGDTPSSHTRTSSRMSQEDVDGPLIFLAAQTVSKFM